LDCSKKADQFTVVLSSRVNLLSRLLRFILVQPIINCTVSEQ